MKFRNRVDVAAVLSVILFPGWMGLLSWANAPPAAEVVAIVVLAVVPVVWIVARLASGVGS